MARKHPRAYPTDFRLKIVELARSGRGADELADEFKLARQAVRNWIKQADLDAGRRSDGVTSADQDENARLRKRIRQLETERDILSKAAAWFARETLSIVRDPAQPAMLRMQAARHLLDRIDNPFLELLF